MISSEIAHANRPCALVSGEVIKRQLLKVRRSIDTVHHLKRATLLMF
jgi:hypothetical protein